MDEMELKYLKGLAKQYPTIAEAATEIINLRSILNLPKGTEHFLSDIHGEYEQFQHVLKNGSGSIRRKIDDEFGNTLSIRDKKSLATLIYYPQEKMERILREEPNIEDWYKITLHRLIQMCKRVSSKYTRSKVRKALPKDFAYIIEEMITEKDEVQDKEAYYNEILNTIISINRAQEFIVALCELIQRLVIDHLHIVGDIFDRGPGAAPIMDILMRYHSVDIQWGNHDILWMGAASGHMACIANVIRICAKYGNLDTLEDDYGINMVPLATFAMETYKNDGCACFGVDYRDGEERDARTAELEKKMHKAIAVIQFKLEGQLILSRPEFEMEGRLLLDKINYEDSSVRIDGTDYHLDDCHFPTVDPSNPYALTEEEAALMEKIRGAFLRCGKLQQHVRFLFLKGSLYKVYNSNLLYHGCVPFDDKGDFKKVRIFGQEYSGKGLYDVLESYARKGYYSKPGTKERKDGQDIMWYIWSNENSPVYGKAKMATFERYFIRDEKIRSERKNDYYELIKQDEIVTRILEEFGLDPEESHIINGHMPVKVKKGEQPVYCNGRLLIIDGGFSRAYQKQTGIAGYTLVYNSYGLRLVAHEPFESTEAAIEKESDIHSDITIVEEVRKRKSVEDTDIGRELEGQIRDWEKLLRAYRGGAVLEGDV